MRANDIRWTVAVALALQIDAGVGLSAGRFPWLKPHSFQEWLNRLAVPAATPSLEWRQ